MNSVYATQNSGESMISRLSALYELSGYSRYRMSKFEEYELYARNRDFLISDNIITFTDTDGKLMALKPDVTLSIVKNGRDEPGKVQKVYYNENVYRVFKGTRDFREITQVGVECIGDTDSYCLFEVLSLAAESLRTVSSGGILSISHLGILSGVMDACGIPENERPGVLRCVGEKNSHELARICRDCGADGDGLRAMLSLVSVTGSGASVPDEIKALSDGGVLGESVYQLEALLGALKRAGFADMIRVDFSVVNDIGYYNGVVFKGYVPGIPAGILSGGQYDRLMAKMNRSSRAVGFAVYLDELMYLGADSVAYDADVVLLYGCDCDPAAVRKKAEELSADGSRVLALRQLPEGLRYGKLVKMDGGT